MSAYDPKRILVTAGLDQNEASDCSTETSVSTGHRPGCSCAAITCSRQRRKTCRHHRRWVLALRSARTLHSI